MGNSTQETNNDITSFVKSAMDKWSKSLINWTVPSDLVSKCHIEEIEDFSGFLVQYILLLGERTGETTDIPYNGGVISHRITDLSDESLWIYGKNTLTEIPLKFDTSKGLFSSKWKPFYIGTGTTRKCPTCKGKGYYVCSRCKGRGKILQSIPFSHDKYWEDCSCGNGYDDCFRCSQYGWIEDAIKCKTSYRTSSEFRVIYLGPNFDGLSSEQTKRRIQDSFGVKVLQEVFDYPVNQLRRMAAGGVDSAEYLQLQNTIRKKLKTFVHQKVSNTERGVQNLYQALNVLLDSMPNPAQANKVLEHEILPVRIRFTVYRKHVYKVKYSYKNKRYSLFVYGSEQKIRAGEKPREFTTKAKALVSILVIFIIFVFLIFCVLIIFWLWNNGDYLLNQLASIIKNII